MHPTEFWWLVEVYSPIKMYGSMTESEVEQLYEETYGDVG